MTKPITIIGGCITEHVEWVAELLEYGTRDCTLRELRVVAGGDEPMEFTDRNFIDRLARIAWRPDTGEIVHLWVAPHLRRMGVATRLYRAAQDLTENALIHSSFRTPDGQKWALSLGEPLPKWSLA